MYPQIPRGEAGIVAHVCDLSPSMIKTQAEKSRGTTARLAIELKWYAKVRSLITGKDQSHTRAALTVTSGHGNNSSHLTLLPVLIRGSAAIMPEKWPGYA